MASEPSLSMPGTKRRGLGTKHWNSNPAPQTPAELCRREQINQNLYYRWSKEFLEAGKKRLAGDTKREATSDEVKELRAQSVQLKELLAEMMLENRLLKKNVLGDEDVGI